MKYKTIAVFQALITTNSPVKCLLLLLLSGMNFAYKHPRLSKPAGSCEKRPL